MIHKTQESVLESLSIAKITVHVESIVLVVVVRDSLDFLISNNFELDNTVMTPVALFEVTIVGRKNDFIIPRK